MQHHHTAIKLHSCKVSTEADSDFLNSMNLTILRFETCSTIEGLLINDLAAHWLMTLQWLYKMRFNNRYRMPEIGLGTKTLRADSKPLGSVLVAIFDLCVEMKIFGFGQQYRDHFHWAREIYREIYMKSLLERLSLDGFDTKKQGRSHNDRLVGVLFRGGNRQKLGDLALGYPHFQRFCHEGLEMVNEEKGNIHKLWKSFHSATTLLNAQCNSSKKVKHKLENGRLYIKRGLAD
jgi:hypothetical protein